LDVGMTHLLLAYPLAGHHKPRTAGQTKLKADRSTDWAGAFDV
jgi:hypothetical protein